MPTSKRSSAQNAVSIVSARYDTEGDKIIVDFSTGAQVVVSRALVPGFKKANAAELADLQVMPGGGAVWSDTVDDGVHLDQLIELVAGDALLRQIGARAFASARTPKRAAAARANGAKGGRPRRKNAA